MTLRLWRSGRVESGAECIMRHPHVAGDLGVRSVVNRARPSGPRPGPKQLEPLPGGVAATRKEDTGSFLEEQCIERRWCTSTQCVVGASRRGHSGSSYSMMGGLHADFDYRCLGAGMDRAHDGHRAPLLRPQQVKSDTFSEDIAALSRVSSHIDAAAIVARPTRSAPSPPDRRSRQPLRNL